MLTAGKEFCTIEVSWKVILSETAKRNSYLQLPKDPTKSKLSLGRCTIQQIVVKFWLSDWYLISQPISSAETMAEPSFNGRVKTPSNVIPDSKERQSTAFSVFEHSVVLIAAVPGPNIICHTNKPTGP